MGGMTFMGFMFTNIATALVNPGLKVNYHNRITKDTLSTVSGITIRKLSLNVLLLHVVSLLMPLL